jgi:hypothetical protein
MQSVASGRGSDRARAVLSHAKCRFAVSGIPSSSWGAFAGIFASDDVPMARRFLLEGESD